MARLRACGAALLAITGIAWTADAWAADIIPTKAPPATVESAPTVCTDENECIKLN